MKTHVIIAAGGRGERFKSPLPKPLVPLCGKPIIEHCLGVFQECPSVESIIIVAPGQFRAEFERVLENGHFAKVRAVVEGGATRRESVHNGLAALDSTAEYVVIHDAVRPFIEPAALEEAISAATHSGAAILAVPVKSTIKIIDTASMMVRGTVDRQYLWEVQTPQVFRKDIICTAHEKVADENPTDDALLVERLGVTVRVVRGDHANIKITTPEDLLFAESLIQSRVAGKQ